MGRKKRNKKKQRYDQQYNKVIIYANVHILWGVHVSRKQRPHKTISLGFYRWVFDTTPLYQAVKYRKRLYKSAHSVLHKLET